MATLRSIIAAILFLAFASLSVSAQDPQLNLQNRANEIRSAMDARDFERAERLVRELRETNATAFLANSYDYLLARLAERRGALTEAQGLYLGALNRNSALSQYALWHLSLIARQEGSFSIERQYLTRLIASYPSSLLLRAARSRLIENLIETADYRAAVTLLAPAASASSAEGRRALAKLGEVNEKLGEAAAARNAYSQLVSGLSDDNALAGVIGLDRLARGAVADLTEVDSLRR